MFPRGKPQCRDGMAATHYCCCILPCMLLLVWLTSRSTVWLALPVVDVCDGSKALERRVMQGEGKLGQTSQNSVHGACHISLPLHEFAETLSRFNH